MTPALITAAVLLLGALGWLAVVLIDQPHGTHHKPRRDPFPEDRRDGGRVPAWEPVEAATGPVPTALDTSTGDSPWADHEPFSDWERDSVVMRALDKEGNPR